MYEHETEESFKKANIAKLRENLMNTSLGIMDAIEHLDEGELNTCAAMLDELISATRYSSMAVKALAKMDTQ